MDVGTREESASDAVSTASQTFNDAFCNNNDCDAEALKMKVIKQAVTDLHDENHDDTEDESILLKNPLLYKRTTILSPANPAQISTIVSPKHFSIMANPSQSTVTRTSQVKVKRFLKKEPRTEAASDVKQGIIGQRTDGDGSGGSKRFFRDRTSNLAPAGQSTEESRTGSDLRIRKDEEGYDEFPEQSQEGIIGSNPIISGRDCLQENDERGHPPGDQELGDQVGLESAYHRKTQGVNVPERHDGKSVIQSVGNVRDEQDRIQPTAEGIWHLPPASLHEGIQGLDGGNPGGERRGSFQTKGESKVRESEEGGTRGEASTERELRLSTGSSPRQRPGGGRGRCGGSQEEEESIDPSSSPSRDIHDGVRQLCHQLDGAGRQEETSRQDSEEVNAALEKLEMKDECSKVKVTKNKRIRKALRESLNTSNLEGQSSLFATERLDEFSIFTAISAPRVQFEHASQVRVGVDVDSKIDADMMTRLLMLAANSVKTDPKTGETKQCRLGFIEYCCETNSEIKAMCEKLGIDHLCIDRQTDALKESTQEICYRFIDCHDVVHAHAAVPCTPWSQIQRLNEAQYGENFIQRLAKARRQNLLLVARFLLIARKVRSKNGTSSFEWPKNATGWDKPLVRQLIQENAYTETLVDGCSVGMVSHRTGQLVLKPWKFVTDNPDIRESLYPLRCDKQHKHTPIEGSDTERSGRYNKELAGKIVKPWMKYALKKFQEQQDKKKTLEIEEMFSVMTATKEEIKAFSELSAKRRQELTDAARKIHVNTGHRPVSELARLLRKQGAPPESRCAMENIKCSTCAENRRPEPSPVVSLHSSATPFKHVSMDLKEVTDKTHKHKYLMMICDATRFVRAIKIHTIPKNQHKNATSAEVIHAIEQDWISIFGDMEELRHDPEGAFVSTELIEEMSQRGIHLRPVAGEAHWQNGVIERAIQTVFSTANRIMSEMNITLPRAVALAVASHNHQEMVHGFSPAQWALGRSPSWSNNLHDELEDKVNIARDGHEAFAKRMNEQISARKIWEEEDVKRKMQRAMRAKHRVDKVFVPGEIVYAWRLGTGKVAGTKKTGLHRGAWYGPATVLGTESKIEDGVVTPSSIVWVIVSDRLWRCAPQQLRRASEREHAQHLLTQDKPWTFENITKTLVLGSFRDVTGDGAPDEGEIEEGNPVPGDEEMRPGMPA